MLIFLTFITEEFFFPSSTKQLRNKYHMYIDDKNECLIFDISWNEVSSLEHAVYHVPTDSGRMGYFNKKKTAMLS